MGVALNRRCELRVRRAASASHSSTEAASSVLSTSSESWTTRVGRANSSTRHDQNCRWWEGSPLAWGHAWSKNDMFEETWIAICTLVRKSVVLFFIFRYRRYCEKRRKSTTWNVFCLRSVSQLCSWEPMHSCSSDHSVHGGKIAHKTESIPGEVCVKSIPFVVPVARQANSLILVKHKYT